MSLLHGRPHLWILKDRIPIPCDDVLKWGRWFEEHRAERIVAQTDVDDEVRVSTVFLGVDHSYTLNPEDPPTLFETMAFGEEKVSVAFGRAYTYREDLGQWRYSTYAEAERGHEEIVQLMRSKLEAAHAAITKHINDQRVK